MKIATGRITPQKLYLIIGTVLGLVLLFSSLFPIFYQAARRVSDGKPGLWGYPVWYVSLVVFLIIGWTALLVTAVLLIALDDAKKLHKWYILILISVSLLRALLYSAIIPPWQSPDEHAHFEYAALLGQLRRIPTLRDLNDEMQSRIVASMFEYNFWQLIKRQPVESPPEGFIIQSGIFEAPATHVVNNRFLYYPQVEADPPLYYFVPALIYTGLIESDTALQLYGMRLATVLMFVLLVVSASWASRKIFPDDAFLAIEITTFIAFFPMLTYMGSVLNNDVLATVFATVLLGILVVVIRFGLSWQRVILTAGLLFLGLLTRYTSVWTIPLVAGLGTIYACWKHKILRYAAFALGMVVLISFGLFFIPSGRTRHWNSVSSSGATVTNRTAYRGKYALRVAGTLSGVGIVKQDLLTQSVLDLQGRQVSLAAWVRADNNQQKGWLAIEQDDKTSTRTEFVADTQWQKVELQFVVPETQRNLQIMLETAPGMVIYFDDVTITALTSPESQFELLRNGSAEQVSTFGEVVAVRLSELVKFSKPVQRFFSVWQDNLFSLLKDPWPIKLSIQSFWGNFGAALLIPMNPSTYKTLNFTCVVSAIGMILYVYRLLARKLSSPRWQVYSLLLCCVALLLVLFEVFMPLLAMYGMWTPQGRYLFPVILPIATFFVLGWNQIVPRRIHRGLLLFLILGLGIWDYLVLRILLNYFYAV